MPVAAMGELLADFAGRPGTDGEPAPARPPKGERARLPFSGFTCPECSGALWELREAELVRYRCRVGHSYSEDAMVDAQGTAVEAALWSALQGLEERSELLRRIASRMSAQPRTQSASRSARVRPRTVRPPSAASCHSGCAMTASPRTRPSRRCWSSSSAAAGWTSRATSARACSAASAAAWRRSAARPSATTSTTSRCTPTSTSSSSRCC